MEAAIRTAGFFGIAVLAVILYDVWFESKERNKKKQVFTRLVIWIFLSLVLDIIYHLPMKWADIYIVRYALPLLRLIMPFIAYILFLTYLRLHVSIKTEVPVNLFLVGQIFCLIGIASAFYYGFSGKLFVIQNGKFFRGEYYEGYLLSFLVVIVYMMIIVLVNARMLGIHDIMAAIIFLMIPACFVVINLYFPELEFSVPSLSISMLVINTMLQAEREHHLIANEERYSTLAHSDGLTGLKNRLAFDNVCDNMNGSHLVGVVFADINGLKHTNDRYGHKAGDELLCRFSDILLECFPSDELFRISGDEFVVLACDIPKDIFEGKVHNLQEKILSQEPPAASIGSVHGIENKINVLLDIAEKEMYASKKEFYIKYPEMKRV